MKIAIAGYGVEGKASYEYYSARDNDVVIADERPMIDAPEGAVTILGPEAFGRLGEFDRIIRSPSVNPKKLPYPGKVWSATNEFFEHCPAYVIGVTGSKGKGTTASLIASILEAAGGTVHLVGNIGVPMLAKLPEISAEDIVVCELSSFQLWDIKRNPEVAVLLPIEPDHLDIHDSFEDYYEAKLNIARFQSEEDLFVAHTTHKELERRTEFKARLMFYPSAETVHVKDGWFYAKDRKLCPLSALRLPGAHNSDNACAALLAACFLIPNERADDIQEIFSKGLSSFTGLPHRLKYVGTVKNVEFYDDSIATTPGSAIAALRAFEQPKVIILGGSDKGAGYEELIGVCHETDAQVIAIGKTGETIAQLCRAQGVRVYNLGPVTMDEVVDAALNCAQPESVIILSPASASFDMFKNYSDRGDQFIAAVKRREGAR